MAHLSPLNLFLDATGGPLRYGKVATSAATYRDAAEEHLHTNPIILGADGMPPSAVYFPGTITLTVTDADDGAIATYTDIRGVAPVHYVQEDIAVGPSGSPNSIIDSTDGDITFAPAPAGSLVIDGLTLPKETPVNTYTFRTDGDGTLSLGPNGVDLSVDLTPQLGGDLDCNGNSIKLQSSSDIEDNSGNELMTFSSTGSAVNYIDIANAATANNPDIAAAGGDTNIGLSLESKGSGAVSISGVDCPTADGTAGQMLQTDGAGTMSLGDGPIATDAEMEAGTSTTTWGTPSNLNSHPGIAKAYINFTGYPPTIKSVYGCSAAVWYSGWFKVTFDVAFATADYSVVASVEDSDDRFVIIRSQTTTYCEVQVLNPGTGDDINFDNLSLAFYGEQ